MIVRTLMAAIHVREMTTLNFLAGAVVHKLVGHQSTIVSVAFTIDSSIAITGKTFASINILVHPRLCSLPGWSPLRVVEPDRRSSRCISLQPYSQQIARVSEWR